MQVQGLEDERDPAALGVDDAVGALLHERGERREVNDCEASSSRFDRATRNRRQ